MHRCGYRQAMSFPIRTKTSYRSVIAPLGLILSGAVRCSSERRSSGRGTGGWGRLLRNEVIPFSTSDWKSWSWTSNYTGHLLEGGIANRRLTEWYEARGVPGAAVLAGIRWVPR